MAAFYFIRPAGGYFNRPDGTSLYVRFGSSIIAPAITSAVDDRISGLTPSTSTRNLFSVYDFVPPLDFTRSATVWCADVDTSCVGVWKTFTQSEIGFSLIAPRLALTAWHTITDQFSWRVGYQVIFVAMDGTEVQRSVLGWFQIPNTDLGLILLDYPVSSNIVPASLMPPEYATQAILGGCPAIVVEAVGLSNKVAYVAELHAISNSIVNYQEGDYDGWYKRPIVGDSGHPVLVINGTNVVQVTLFTSSGSGNNIGYYAPQIIAQAAVWGVQAPEIGSFS